MNRPHFFRHDFMRTYVSRFVCSHCLPLARVLLVGAMLVAGIAGAQTLQDFAASVELTVDGKQALYELAVPGALYEGVVRADLGDVRVFNGTNEIVPHAFRPRAPTQPTPADAIQLTPFVLTAPAGVATEGFNARIERDGNRFRFEVTDRPATATERVVGYVLDTSQIERPIRAMRIDIGAMPGNVASSIRVESSDDLRSWRTVVSGAPIVRLEAAGQQLRQDRIEFSPLKAKYWRLSWTGERRALEVSAVEAELSTGPIEPAREWKEFVAAPTGKPGEYVFDTRGRFPADRLRFALPQSNTVAVVEILTRSRSSDSWRFVTTATIYRLMQDGTEVTSAPVPVPLTADGQWLVRVDQRGGGIGLGALSASIGWVPHRLVFVARGGTPFQLAFGSARAEPSSYRIDTLIPGYRSDQALEPGKAQAQGPAMQPVASATVQGTVRTISGDAARAPSTPTRLWALWASIIGGVLVLGLMAWKLSRQLAASTPRTTDPAPGSSTNSTTSASTGSATPHSTTATSPSSAADDAATK